jgi:hypothetical protein
MTTISATRCGCGTDNPTAAAWEAHVAAGCPLSGRPHVPVATTKCIWGGCPGWRQIVAQGPGWVRWRCPECAVESREEVIEPGGGGRDE